MLTAHQSGGSGSELSQPIHPLTGRRQARNRVLIAIAVVFLGGAIGSIIRSLISFAFPSEAGSFPLTTLAINLVGSFLLGALIQALALAGGDARWRRTVRLGAGTGVMGGFTTYSMFGLETVSLIQAGHLVRGLSYALLSVIAGIAAAVIAIRIVRWVWKQAVGHTRTRM